MDEIESVGPSEVRLEDLVASAGEKRPCDDGEDGDLGAPSPKKTRIDGGLIGSMKKVAEIVMVLAVMGKMRAGRSPSAVEEEMMKEAKVKLVDICGGFAPKDIFPRDAFGIVIEDLGLNKSRAQSIGLPPPKISISEKLLRTKQKMEKSDEIAVRCGTYSSQRLQANSIAAAFAESRGTSHAVRVVSSDKPTHTVISSAGFQPASPVGHVSAVNSASLPYHLPASEVKSFTVTSGPPPSNLGRVSLSGAPKVERAQFRLDGRSNGSYALQATTSGNQSLVKTPTWSLQPQTVSFAKTEPDNKMPAHPSTKVEGTSDLSMSRVSVQPTPSKPFQTISGNLPSVHQHLQGMKFVQVPQLYNNHNEIGRTVLKLLQPHLPKHPTWTPPSRDYMNKALSCQVCRITINEVENVLVCDACEKGFHLKCLQSNQQKTILKGGWHCEKCLMSNNGKPLPPKYGRVMRNATAPNLSSNTTAAHASGDRNDVTWDEKVSQQKLTQNGHFGLQGASTVTRGNDHNCSEYPLDMPNAREIQGDITLLNKKEVTEKPCLETGADTVLKNSGLACLDGLPVENISEVKLVSESNTLFPEKLPETDTNMLNLSKASHNFQDNDQTGFLNRTTIPLKPYHDKSFVVKDLEKSYIREASDCISDCEKQGGQGFTQAYAVETSEAGARDHSLSSSDCLHFVDWIGDVLQVVDEKIYYQSCCINGIVYKLQDNALFHSSGDLFIPSKIQAMWEDGKTQSKWVVVSRCYFPDDLPAAVGRPCSPETNEVYESNHEITLIAGLIRGPCEVLPHNKFIEENQRRVRLGIEENDDVQPLFLCRWFYDKLKGLFRDVSSCGWT